VYQNIANLSEIVVVDPKADVVRNTITTPELTSNHPLQFDPGLNQLAAAGVNGVMSAYDPSGKKFGSVEVPKGIDQCDLDPGTHVLACAHGNGVTLVQLTKDSAPKVIDETPVPAGTHTVAIDAKTHDVWIVWARPDGTGDFYQRLTRPTAP
jgi:hypothetical protein